MEYYNVPRHFFYKVNIINNNSVGYRFREFTIIHEDIHGHSNEEWQTLIDDAKEYVDAIKKEEAEAEKREQERKELQNKRYAELYPYAQYSYPVAMDSLWQFPEDKYLGILEGKKAAFQKAQEERNKQIAEAAAKEERERIEEEQRQAELKRKYELRKARMSMLVEHGLKYHGDLDVLGEISEETWMKDFNELKANRDEIIRKQEEERKAEELAQASEKVKWKHLVDVLSALQIPRFVSGQYAKKAAILREKLEEIKAL